jgi:ABC-type dipeptide/oligopeptide/nickel transport system permease subunit
VGFAATAIALFLGIPIGPVAGYYRGLSLLMRALDVVMSLVMLILAIT